MPLPFSSLLNKFFNVFGTVALDQNLDQIYPSRQGRPIEKSLSTVCLAQIRKKKVESRSRLDQNSFPQKKQQCSAFWISNCSEMIILTSVYRTVIAIGDRCVPSKLKPLWEHPAGQFILNGFRIQIQNGLSRSALYTQLEISIVYSLQFTVTVVLSFSKAQIYRYRILDLILNSFILLTLFFLCSELLKAKGQDSTCKRLRCQRMIRSSIVNS